MGNVHQPSVDRYKKASAIAIAKAKQDKLDAADIPRPTRTTDKPDGVPVAKAKPKTEPKAKKAAPKKAAAKKPSAKKASE